MQIASTNEYGALKEMVRTWGKRDPIDALAMLVVGGGISFYLAERASNAQCQTPWDGILYMATALSVGYDNLFPTTPTGHALATFAQTFGPALASSALDEPAERDPERQIIERLDAIVKLLERA